MSDEVLRLRGVGVRHDRSMLLRDVDWTMRSDESWVVVGPNEVRPEDEARAQRELQGARERK